MVYTNHAHNMIRARVRDVSSSRTLTLRIGQSSSHALQSNAVIGVLSTRGKEPDNGGELHTLRVELQAASVEISSLKLEIVHLTKELDLCVQGDLCSIIVEYRIFHVSCCQFPLFFPKGKKVTVSHGHTQAHTVTE